MKSLLIKLTAALTLGALAALATPALAAADGGTEPVKMVKQTANQLLTDIRANKQTYQSQPQKLYELADKVVLPHFDSRYMSQLVLGRYWRQATPQQRDQFVDAFKALLVRTYATSLLQYTDAKLEWLPAQVQSGEALVRSRASGANLAAPVPINYRVHKTSDGWKVYDVTVEGISLVTNYRSSYASIIRSQGIDTLIQKLKQKATQQG